MSSSLQRKEFRREDLELLVSLGSVAALRIRNLRLAEEAAERQRIEQEIRLARQIQIALLPERLPEVAGYQLSATTVPSRGVSGDFYEVVERRQGAEVLLLVADVSGKGIGASLLTASLEALLASPIEQGAAPADICETVGRRLYARTPASKYATAFLAVLDRHSGRLAYANAGHNPALLVRAGGEVVRLASTGPPIGLLPGAVYLETSEVVERGDALLIYTDGITEAENGEQEEFGEARLEQVLVANRRASPAEITRCIEAAGDAFVDGVPFADDRTLVALRRLC